MSNSDDKPSAEWFRRSFAAAQERATAARRELASADREAQAYARLHDVLHPNEPPLAPTNGATQPTIADMVERVAIEHGGVVTSREALKAIQSLGFLVNSKDRNSAISSVTSAVSRDRRRRFTQVGPNKWTLAMPRTHLTEPAP